MAWTTPKTWSVGETLTAANLNTHIRDNGVETWHRIARKTADESVTSSTALQTDDHLTFSVAANEVWALEWMLLGTSNGAGDWQFAYSFPSGNAYTFGMLPDTSGVVDEIVLQHTATDNTPFSTQGYGANRLIRFATYFVNGGTGGTFALRWAQQVSNGAANTLLTNSILLGMKVA
jgi:hypothetical protein